MTLKSNVLYWTLFRPKYWAGSEARREQQEVEVPERRVGA